MADQSKLVRGAAYISEHLGQILVAVGGLVLAVYPFFVDAPLGVKPSSLNWWKSVWPIVVGAGLAIWGVLLTTRAGDSLSRTQQENQALKERVGALSENMLASLEDQLQILMDVVLKLGDTERVSVYFHSKQDKAFVSVGRYSKHPDHGQPGRPIYPDNQGCIAMAWTSGHASIRDLPDRLQSRSEWLQGQRQYGLSQKVANKLRMSSREYEAFALENSSKSRIAVIVFESSRTNVLPGAQALRDVLFQGEADRLGKFLERLGPQIPDPGFAHRQGY